MTPLHYIGEFVRSSMQAIPLSAVRMIFLAVPILLLIWVLRLPNSKTTRPDGTGSWTQNLKFAASIALLIQILIYSLL